MRVARLAGRPVTPELRACHAALGPGPEDYRELAALLADGWAARAPQNVGLGGGQGAGKSTLGRLLVEACAGRGLRAALLSIDDFYLERAARRELARRVHPLFETRGPPGTHDVALCEATLQALHEPGEVRVPVFDKGRDDRDGWRRLRGPFDLVILEGWCVGAGPLAPHKLATPANDLERERDPDGRWRAQVADQLAGPYAALFRRLDCLVFLAVPDLDAVRRWRLQQEHERPPAQRLSARSVERFVEHYERITLAMLAELPARADVVVALDADHAVAGVHFRDAAHPEDARPG